jgi:hypothetical protein
MMGFIDNQEIETRDCVQVFLTAERLSHPERDGPIPGFMIGGEHSDADLWVDFAKFREVLCDELIPVLEDECFGWLHVPGHTRKHNGLARPRWRNGKTVSMLPQRRNHFSDDALLVLSKDHFHLQGWE